MYASLHWLQDSALSSPIGAVLRDCGVLAVGGCWQLVQVKGVIFPLTAISLCLWFFAVFEIIPRPDCEEYVGRG